MNFICAFVRIFATIFICQTFKRQHLDFICQYVDFKSEYSIVNVNNEKHCKNYQGQHSLKKMIRKNAIC